jgi:hypothetical protein
LLESSKRTSDKLIATLPLASGIKLLTETISPWLNESFVKVIDVFALNGTLLASTLSSRA